MLIFKMGQGGYCNLYYVWRRQEIPSWLFAIYWRSDYPGRNTANHWCSIDTHFKVLYSQFLLPSIIVGIIIWTHLLSFCPIDNQPIGKAEPRHILARTSFILPKLIHLFEYCTLPDDSCLYEQISSCDCSLFSHIISLSEIVGQVIYRTWWKHIDPICPTFSGFPYSSLFPSHWQSLTLVQHVSLTFVLAESMLEHSVWHWQCSALGFPSRRCHCLAWCQIHRLPHICLWSRIDYPNHHSN